MLSNFNGTPYIKYLVFKRFQRSKLLERLDQIDPLMILPDFRKMSWFWLRIDSHISIIMTFLILGLTIGILVFRSLSYYANWYSSFFKPDCRRNYGGSIILTPIEFETSLCKCPCSDIAVFYLFTVFTNL